MRNADKGERGMKMISDKGVKLRIPRLFIPILIALTMYGCGRSDVILRPKDDENLQKIAETARKSWPTFVHAYNNRKPGEKFGVKAPFGDEHMWLEVTEIKGRSIKGNLLNDPVNIPMLHRNDHLQTTLSQIEDWTYEKDGQMIGNASEVLLKPQAGRHVQFFEDDNPNEEKTKAGKIALAKWKNASEIERNSLADDILGGKALKGMTREQVIQVLGAPDSKKSSTTLLSYPACKGETSCNFCVELDSKGGVEKSYIDAYY
jgi:uncharacterized protein YegJ (DUF2314 family)